VTTIQITVCIVSIAAEEVKLGRNRGTSPSPTSIRLRHQSPIGSESDALSSSSRDRADNFSGPPLSSNEEAEMGDGLNIGSYTSSRLYYPSNPRFLSSYTIGFEVDTNSDGRMGFAGGQSWMVVICAGFIGAVWFPISDSLISHIATLNPRIAQPI